MRDKLLKDTLLYGVANFGSKAIVFLMLPLYTHYFSPAEYGLWDLILTTTALLVPFITFELVSAVYRWLLEEKNAANRSRIITTGAVAIVRNLLIFNSIAIFTLSFLTVPYGWLALIFINVDITSSFMQQCARGLSHNKLFASIGIIQTALSVSFILFFIFVLELRLEAFFYASIIAAICVTLYAWIRMQFKQYISTKAYSKATLKSFLTYSMPIIPGAASWWVMTMSDRYFIIGYLGVEYNGIYAVALKVPALLLMINTIFLLAWKDSAILTFDTAQKNEYYSTVFKHFFRFMATTVICLALLTKPILQHVIAADFFHAWKYIGILLIGTLFNACSLFWAAGYHGAKKTTAIFITSFVGAIVNVLANFLFVKHFGLYAIAISTLLAFLTVWLIRVFASKAYFKIAINIRDLLTLCPMIILAILAPFYLHSTGLFICIFLSCVLFFTYNFHLIKLVYWTLVANH